MSFSAREDILQRLRAAEAAHSSGPHSEAVPPEFSEAEIYSDYLDSGDGLIEQFCEMLSKLRGTPRVCDSVPQAASALLELSAPAPGASSDIDPSLVLLEDSELIRNVMECLPANERSRFHFLSAGKAPDNSEFARAATGVTGCDMLIARSGGIALRTISAGGRRLSVLPEHHIVIAGAAQISAGLSPWYRKIAADDDWSYGTLITGPSRTSDIEKILVLGAHGPKRLSVIIIR